MQRRTFLTTTLAASLGGRLLAALTSKDVDTAADVLTKATASGVITSAVLHVTQPNLSFSRSFGKGRAVYAMYLLGSISKPISVTALMTLYDRKEFRLDDPVRKFLPKFTGDGRDAVTVQHLLTHVSGLPDQLPENNELRKQHASLDEFAEHAIRTPLHFAAGTKYEYSSMAIMLAAHIATKISGMNFLEFVQKSVFKPLEMETSAMGLGQFSIEDMKPVQTEHAAPESGAGDPTARDWDWNSPYWRKLGAPWGGAHASATDLELFLSEFLHGKGAVVKPETAKLMLTNHNARGLTPRGLGFNIGAAAGNPGCSDKTFGHTGSTGTLAWADPATQTICVILTTLPARAVQPHPRDIAANIIAKAATP